MYNIIHRNYYLIIILILSNKIYLNVNWHKYDFLKVYFFNLFNNCFNKHFVFTIKKKKNELKFTHYTVVYTK